MMFGEKLRPGSCFTHMRRNFRRDPITRKNLQAISSKTLMKIIPTVPEVVGEPYGLYQRAPAAALFPGCNTSTSS
jgi:hypothetical protein